MTKQVPDFMEWVDVTFDGWKLKEGAPEAVRTAFAEFMRSLDMLETEAARGRTE